MKYFSVNRGIPAGNPIANFFVIIVAALVIGVSVVLGFVAFVVLGSIFVLLAATVGLRLWWFNRKLGKGASGTSSSGPAAPGGVIEGEFRVVDDRRKGARDE